jgi:hypothetical protein
LVAVRCGTGANPIARRTRYATLNGPTLWTGDDYGGGLVGLTIGCTAGTVLLILAARRGHIRPWRLPIARTDKTKSE